MKITLRILTPIWTGDIDSRSDLLQSIGIIGSLRWWTEVILRGMDKFVCDPVGDDRCPKEKKDGNKKISLYCPACLVFGATGMRRIFRLEFSDEKKVFNGKAIKAINIKPKGRNRGWYLGSGLKGEIKLSIVPLSKDFEENLVLVPLTIAVKWGGIGAKTQHGYGVVEIEDCPAVNLISFKNAIEKITDKQRLSSLNLELRTGNNEGLPKLDEMFFAKVRFEVDNTEWWKKVNGIAPRSQDSYQGYVNDQRMKRWRNSDSVPISPAIKNWLRYGKEITTKKGKKIQASPFKEVSNKEISSWLFGSSNNSKTASKINVSCAYPVKNNLWEFRIWGWIPKDELPAGFNRDNFLNALKQVLNGSGNITVPWNEILGNQTRRHGLIVWREFNSSRDTVKPDETDIENYLQSLINGEEEEK